MAATAVPKDGQHSSSASSAHRASTFFLSLFLLLSNALQRIFVILLPSTRANSSPSSTPHPQAGAQSHTGEPSSNAGLGNEHSNDDSHASDKSAPAPSSMTRSKGAVKMNFGGGGGAAAPFPPALPRPLAPANGEPKMNSAKPQTAQPISGGDMQRIVPPATEPEQIARGLAQIDLNARPGPNSTPAASGPNTPGGGQNAPAAAQPRHAIVIQPVTNCDDLTGEKAVHAAFMREALAMAKEALVTNETPVGCVLVHNDRVIARGMNATNVTRNGTRHAELMAISALLSFSPSVEGPDEAEQPVAAGLSKKQRRKQKQRTGAALGDITNSQVAAPAAEPDEAAWGDVDPSDGHLWPWGQKLHPSPRVDRSVITECTLYVTVEPCVMCASLLRQLGIKKVFFGAVNDKFGGTGGVFSIHTNSASVMRQRHMASAPPSPTPRPNGSQYDAQPSRPVLGPRPVSSNDVVDGHNSGGTGTENGYFLGSDAGVAPPLPVDAMPGAGAMMDQGDGGNVEPGYEVEGGWGRDEAVTLLRQFYVQENGRAPIPRKKEGRAARLAAMMERDGHAGGAMAEGGAPGTSDTAEAQQPPTEPAGDQQEVDGPPKPGASGNGEDAARGRPPTQPADTSSVAGASVTAEA